jgi:glycosyltransferase involved in cell wall biosynthesis
MDFISSRLALLNTFHEKGFSISVGMPDLKNINVSDYPQFEFHEVFLERQSVGLFSQIKTFLSINEVFKKTNPDIVFLFRVKPILLGGLVARFKKTLIIAVFTGLGYVFTHHSIKTKIIRFLLIKGYQFIFLKKAKVVFQNPDDRDIFLQLKVIKPQQTKVILGSGIDIKKYTYSDEPHNTSVKVLLIGAIRFEKGIREYVNAAQMLKDKGIKTEFLLVGDVDTKIISHIPEKQLKEWMAEGIIQWHKGIASTEVPSLMRSVNIICLPSYSEGIPRVLIEGAASGRALVTTDVPGCREVVQHNENGLLVPVKNAKLLAEALEKLILSPEKRIIMGKKSREMAEQYFSIEKIILEYIALIQ